MIVSATSLGSDTAIACEPPTISRWPRRSARSAINRRAATGIFLSASRHEPTGQRAPSGLPGETATQGLFGDRPLGPGHERGEVGWHVRGELRMIGVLADRHLVATGRQRILHQRVGERAAGELPRQRKRRLVGVRAEGVDVRGTLRRMATDPDLRMRCLSPRNRDLPVELAKRLAADPGSEVPRSRRASGYAARGRDGATTHPRRRLTALTTSTRDLSPRQPLVEHPSALVIACQNPLLPIVATPTLSLTVENRR